MGVRCLRLRTNKADGGESWRMEDDGDRRSLERLRCLLPMLGGFYSVREARGPKVFLD